MTFEEERDSLAKEHWVNNKRASFTSFSEGFNASLSSTLVKQMATAMQHALDLNYFNPGGSTEKMFKNVLAEYRATVDRINK